MYISQYESTIWKKYIPSKSHVSTHASGREEERERDIHIYVDVRYTCIMFWKISRFTRGRIRHSEADPEGRIVPLNKIPSNANCWLGISWCVHTTRVRILEART